jgi:hypothetical protein
MQSIISWNGRIVALSCIAVNTWIHEMVLCPFFSRPRKKQLRACCVIRRNAIVVKSSFLRSTKSRMSQFEQRENVNFCQKLGHILPTHLISQHAISFSFPAWKKSYVGLDFSRPRRLEIVTATRETVQDLLANNFQQCFHQLYQSWQTCIAVNSDYFEGGCGYVLVYVSIL